MPGAIGQMYSLYHLTDFSAVALEIDLAPIPWKAGGRECFYLTFGKACDSAVACFMSSSF